jgi:hypothetical protein
LCLYFLDGVANQKKFDADRDLDKDPQQRSCNVNSVADPKSGAFLTLDPGFGLGFFRISDSGSQTHIFDSLMTKFGVKSTIILCVLAFKKFS